MKNSIVIIPLKLVLIIILLTSCDPITNYNNESEEFFPLEIGLRWTYKISESDKNVNETAFPNEFTTAIVGKTEIEDKEYFLLENFYVPGFFIPDTVFIRNTNNKTYIRFKQNKEESLLYSFTEKDSLWEVPFNIDSATSYSRKALLTYQDKNTTAISWDLSGFPNNPPYIQGRTESGWGELFIKGVGRTELVSVSQVYGKIVWLLQ